jgi:hypothetical protein
MMMMMMMMAKQTSRSVWIVLSLVVCCGLLAENTSAQFVPGEFIPEDFATCGDCYCVPDDASGTCPDPAPEVNFSDDLISTYQAAVWSNPITLVDNCNPYAAADNDCALTPPQDASAGACILEYTAALTKTTTCPTEPGVYSYVTMDYLGTVTEAEAANKIVTHAGPCGTCSSLQDLAVYLSEGPNLTGTSSGCAFRALVSPADGIACFQEIGFTSGCAAAWNWNVLSTFTNCAAICQAFAISGDPSNGAAPECALAECLQCDEDNSGPIFLKTAGRTRRNSGLLSAIARPCSIITANALVHELPPPLCETDSGSSAVAAASVILLRSISMGTVISMLVFA